MTVEALPAQPDPGPPLPSAQSGSLRRDVLSSYVLTASRLIAWAGVSAIVYRRAGAEAFALLALLRGTITLVSYTSLGIGPAMVRLMAEAIHVEAKPSNTLPTQGQPADSTAVPTLAYFRLEPVSEKPVSVSLALSTIYKTGQTLGGCLFVLGCLLSITYSLLVTTIHSVPFDLAHQAPAIVLAFGCGSAIRFVTEPDSALLQSSGRLWIDNYILALAEILWLSACLIFPQSDPMMVAGTWFGCVVLVTCARLDASSRVFGGQLERLVTPEWLIAGKMFRFGAMLVIAQLADFLYAPTDYILINRLLSPEDVAAYAPLVQIDSALLLLVAGPATALFPHFARAHAGADHRRLRRLYLGATSLSAAALFAVGLSLLLLSPIVFRLWLGQDLPDSRTLLPLVLIHTVVGGSSAIGRSILLGMGKVKALTTSALVAGGANVILSALLASTFGLGLKGIVLGTVVVVVARCAIWMPWYVWRETGKRNA